jgi:hypothetical protein
MQRAFMFGSTRYTAEGTHDRTTTSVGWFSSAHPTTAQYHTVYATVTQTVELVPSSGSLSYSVPFSPTTSTPIAVWTSPPDMTDFSSFGIQAPFYSSNLRFVSVLPSSASSSSSLILPSPSPTSNKLQVLYPKGSINPAGKIKGGADFYANPFDPGKLERATNISISYRAFFPSGFDFVKGGKMPGGFGGRRGCSGGQDAGTAGCFSTRLMWREKGAGELYLYAPRAKQGPAVCKTRPKSVCMDDYGMSIGRGSFVWKTGQWTSVRQTVGLNTPGKKDGTFALFVDDLMVMDIEGVYYRDAVPSGEEGTQTDGDGGDQDDDDAGSSSGDLLKNVVSDVGGLEHVLQVAAPNPTKRDTTASHEPLVPIKVGRNGQFYIIVPVNPTPDPISDPIMLQSTSSTDKSKPAGFAGLFFSTFFGGHDSDWASPRDQYVWFDLFEIDIWE